VPSRSRASEEICSAAVALAERPSLFFSCRPGKGSGDGVVRNGSADGTGVSYLGAVMDRSPMYTGAASQYKSISSNGGGCRDVSATTPESVVATDIANR
jgi:hypothetical protein